MLIPINPKRGGSKKVLRPTLKIPKTGNVVKVEFGAEGGGGKLLS